MSKAEVYRILLDTVVAVGTLAAVVVAIYGDRIKSALHPLKIRLELADSDGTITYNGGWNRNVLMHHVRVVNESGEAVARHCVVMLVGIERLVHGRFAKVSFPVPFRLLWAPRELAPVATTLVHSAIADFGELIPELPGQGGSPSMYRPILPAYPYDFAGTIFAGDTCRYTLEVHAENLPTPPRFTFEVSWDGFWAQNVEEMRDHLKIRTVRTATGAM